MSVSIEESNAPASAMLAPFVVGILVVLLGCAPSGPEPRVPKINPAPATAVADAPVAPRNASPAVEAPEQPSRPDVGPALPKGMDPVDVAEFRHFLTKFVELYNARKFNQVDSVLVASSPIMLIDNWGGLNIRPTFHKSLGRLIGSIDDHVVWGHSPLGEGTWTEGPLRRAGCVEKKPVPPQFLFGPVSDQTLLLETSIGPVNFDVTADRDKAMPMSKDITHFVFDDVAGVQLYFQKRENGWRLIALDLLAPAC